MAGPLLWDGEDLIQAAHHFQKVGSQDRVAIHGVDLVKMFDPIPSGVSCLSLHVPVRAWSPEVKYDLITCVHGLHYVGDKLGLITRAVSWLKPEGLFLAHLDLRNVKLTTGRSFASQLGKQFKQQGLEYDRQRRLLRCVGRCRVNFAFAYAGADDAAGPNFTGQPAVDSYYTRSQTKSPDPLSCPLG